MKERLEHEAPECIEQWGWKYHHLGVPTKNKLENGIYIPHLKFTVLGFKTSPFGIEWMNFDEDCEMHPLVQSVPHLAFEVEDVEAEIAKHNLKVITPVNSPAQGITVAMIEHNNAPLELIAFDKDLLAQ